jgi:hypothetical protein
MAGASISGSAPGYESRALADADGTFVLRGMPAGERIYLSAAAPDHTSVPESWSLNVPAGARSADAGTVRLLEGPDWVERDDSPGELGGYWMQTEGRLRVQQIPPDGPAGRAGLVSGDVVLAIDGVSVEGLGSGAIRYLFSRPPGARLVVQVQTAAGSRTVEVVLGRR